MFLQKAKMTTKIGSPIQRGGKKVMGSWRQTKNGALFFFFFKLCCEQVKEAVTFLSFQKDI